jgi:mono/diheme cytochrome c family protein
MIARREWEMRLRLALLAALTTIFPVFDGGLAVAGEAGAASSRNTDATDIKPSSGDSTQGEKLYAASCVVCHGQRAVGGIGPRLAGNPVISNDLAYWKVVYEGQHVMPPLKGALTDRQMADIRAWLQTLR